MISMFTSSVHFVCGLYSVNLPFMKTGYTVPSLVTETSQCLP